MSDTPDDNLCPVCEGAGWDWKRCADEDLQVDDRVDEYRCDRCDGTGRIANQADTVKVELVGGPLDGDTVVLPNGVDRLKLPIPTNNLRSILSEPAPSLDAEIGYTEAWYEPRTPLDRRLRRWTWMGAPL
jgi:hypothetical protein